MIRSTLPAVVLASCLALLTGCQMGPRPWYDVAEDWPQISASSVAWAEHDAPAEGDGEASARLHQRVRTTVEAELRSRGYEFLAPGAKADLWVDYAVYLRDKTVRLRPMNVRDEIVVQYDEGTLELRFARPGTDRPLWEGHLQAEVDPDPDNIPVERAVTRLLEPFPPAR